MAVYVEFASSSILGSHIASFLSFYPYLLTNLLVLDKQVLSFYVNLFYKSVLPMRICLVFGIGLPLSRNYLEFLAYE